MVDVLETSKENVDVNQIMLNPENPRLGSAIEFGGDPLPQAVLQNNLQMLAQGEQGKSDLTTPRDSFKALKASIIQITKYLGTLYAKNKIIINCISPGGTVDDSVNVSKSFRLRYSKKVPMGRMGSPEEMITTIMYLSSDYTTYTVGQNIIVDGGFSSW